MRPTDDDQQPDLPDRQHAGGSPNFGSIAGGANTTTEEKWLLKLDWNITADHRMTVRFSDTVGSQPSFGGLNSFNFSGGAALTGAPTIGRIAALTSNFYATERTEEVWAGQIFSNWSPALKTSLAYSKIDLLQDSISPVKFPEVRVYGVPGTDANTGRPYQRRLSSARKTAATATSRGGHKGLRQCGLHAGAVHVHRRHGPGGGELPQSVPAEFVWCYWIYQRRELADTPFAFTRARADRLPDRRRQRVRTDGDGSEAEPEPFNFTLGLRYDWMGAIPRGERPQCLRADQRRDRRHSLLAPRSATRPTTSATRAARRLG